MVRRHGMSVQEPMTRTITISDIETHLAPLVEDVARNELRVIVEEAGTPVAAVISVADLERWSRFDRERDARFEVLDRLRAAFADVPSDELEREIASALAEVREEMAAEREATGRTA
jgi:prevent-host-death family protein